MKGKRSGLVVGTIVLCGLLASWATKRQQIVLQPCPFDPNLSVGVAFQGPHLHFDTYAVQDKLMNARIAWFSNTEHPDPDIFNDRVFYEPPEEDWDWWTTLFPATLILQVTDAQNRLGKVEVFKYEGNILKGIFPANQEGSTVTGSLELERPTSFWRLTIKDRRGETLAEALVKNPETQLTVVERFDRWIPHPPKRDVVVELDREEPHHLNPGKHPVLRYDFEKKQTVTEYADCIVKYWRAKEGCPPHTGFKEQHFTTVAIFGPPPEGCSILDTRGSESCGTWVDVILEGPFPVEAESVLCMTKQFDNDYPSTAKIPPPQDYCKRYVRQRIREFPKPEALTDLARPIVERLKDMQSTKPEDGTSITPSIEVLPYSKGCLHWDINAKTDIRTILVAPVRKVEKHPTIFDYILAALREVVRGIMGSANPKKNRVVEALVEAWTKDISQREKVKEAFKVGDLKFYGDIWVLYLSLATAGPMYPPPLQNITQDIKVQVVVVKPDGTKEAMYGSVTIERLRATTTPEPPKAPLPEQITVDIPSEGKVISLGKGWRWKLTAFAVGRSATKEISVPLEPPSVVIEVPAPQPPPGGG